MSVTRVVIKFNDEFLVLYPFIDSFCDPDYFNRKVIEYIEAQKIAATMHRRTFEYANSFEDFLKMIQKSHDVDHLKRIRSETNLDSASFHCCCYRYDIVTKIMQATTLQNLNRAKGVDPDIEKGISNPSNINKSEINAAKKLKRYISQLTYAKKECEKRLTSLGWDLGFHFQDEKNKVGNYTMTLNIRKKINLRITRF